MNTKQVIGSIFRIFGAGIILVTIGIVACNFALSRATKYCPLKHRLTDTALCTILDNQKGTVLLQHFDLDTNQAYLEIRDQRGAHFYEFPDTKIVNLDNYSGTLIPGSLQMINLNGQAYNLKSLKSRTW